MAIVVVDGAAESQQRMALLARVNQQKEEAVVYYRKPPIHPRTKEPLEEAGWITWGDSQDLKLKTYIQKGFTQMPEYGMITDSRDPWGPILSHPSGPAEFPLDQIVTYRWFDPARLRQQWKSMPFGLRPQRVFPQLREYLRDGNELHEYPCPQCAKTSYLKPLDLARHLADTHNLSQADILEIGRQLGTDFGVELRRGRIKVYDYEPGAEVEDVVAEEDEEYPIHTTTVLLPKRGPGRPPKIQTEGPTVTPPFVHDAGATFDA